MQSCPVCHYSYLRCEDEDSRQEWTRLYYSCPKCKNEFTRKITYKCQSSMVQSDEWEHTDEDVERWDEAWQKQLSSKKQTTKTQKIESELDTIEHAAKVLVQLLTNRSEGTFTWYQAIRDQMKILDGVYHKSGMDK